MAVFNPQVQQTPDQPLWYGAKSITEPRPDTSKEKALEGLAKGIGGAVDVAEGYVEQTIKAQEHTGLDTINDEAISRLEAAKANPLLVAQNSAPPTPEALRGLPKTLDSLDQARANNKLSQTYIDMQKDALAKSLRAQYPGHRDFIDETFSKSSREDPANRYISSLVGDINSLSSAANEQKNATKTLVMKGLTEFPSSSHWDQIANDYMSGKVPDDIARSLFFKYSAQNADYKREDQEFQSQMHGFEFDKSKRANVGQQAKDIMNERSGQSARDFFYNHTMSTPGLRTPSSIADIAEKAAAGGIKLSPEQRSDMVNQLVAAKAAYMKDMYTQFSTSADPSQPSYATLATAEETQKIIADHAKLFDTVIDQFTNEKYGLTASSLNTIKSIDAEIKLGLYNNADPVLRAYFRSQAALSKDMPPAALNKIIGSALYRNIDTKFLDYVKRSYEDALSPPPENRTSDDPHSIKADISRLQDNRKTPQGSEGAKIYKSLLDGVNSITQKDIPDDNKRNAVDKYFAPANRGLISKFDDYTSVFKQMTSDPIIKEAHKLGGQSWDHMQDWVMSSFGTELYPKAIRDIQRAESSPLPGVTITYNDQEHQFAVKGKVTTQVGPKELRSREIDPPELSDLRSSVDKLNQGLKSVSGMAKYNNQDVNAYIHELMTKSGYSGKLLTAVESTAPKGSEE